MGAADMGRVTTEATVQNLGDLLLGRPVRTAVVTDAVVDESVPYLLLPADVVGSLGLDVRSTSWGGPRGDPVRVEIGGRQATLEPVPSPGSRVVLGHIVLTALGLKCHPERGLVDHDYPSR